MLKLPFAFCQSQFFSKPFCKIQPTIMKGFDVVSSSTIMLSNALQITLVQRGECWSLQKSNTANVSSGWCKILESRIFLHLEFGAVAWPTRSSHRCDLLFRVSCPKLVTSVRNVESPLLCCPFLLLPIWSFRTSHWWYWNNFLAWRILCVLVDYFCFGNSLPTDYTSFVNIDSLLCFSSGWYSVKPVAMLK